MLSTLPGVSTDLVEVVGTTLLTALFTAVGAYWEELAAQSMLAGDTKGALVVLYFGTLALFVGLYLLGYGELLPRLRAYRSRA